MPTHVPVLVEYRNARYKSVPFYRGRQTVRANECPWPYLVLHLVAVDVHNPIVQVPGSFRLE